MFTKFPSCVTGPNAVVTLPGTAVDWEVEPVVIIGIGGHAIPAAKAWDHVAGFMVGKI